MILIGYSLGRTREIRRALQPCMGHATAMYGACYSLGRTREIRRAGGVSCVANEMSYHQSGGESYVVAKDMSRAGSSAGGT